MEWEHKARKLYTLKIAYMKKGVKDTLQMKPNYRYTSFQNKHILEYFLKVIRKTDLYLYMYIDVCLACF